MSHAAIGAELSAIADLRSERASINAFAAAGGAVQVSKKLGFTNSGGQPTSN